MHCRNHLAAAGRLALGLCAAVVLHAQQSERVVSGLATTIPSENAPEAVSIVTVADSTRPPAARLETLVDGRVPGATIESSTSDAPGEGPQLRFRGVTSLNGTDAPLYIVDGVMVMSQLPRDATGAFEVTEGNGMNRIADIDPGDIASIQVLKGPSATAIYGAEGAAGVVIITTKQGTPGTTHWDLNGAIGHYALAREVPVRQFPRLASAQAWYVNDVTHDTTAAKISADDAFIQSTYAGPQDYQGQIFGNSQVSFLTRISTNGTVAATQYYFSALSRYDNGVAINTGDDRQSLRGSIAQRIGGVLSLTATVDYIGDVTRQGSITDGIEADPYQVMTYTPAFVDLNHEEAGAKWAVNPFGTSNPFADEMEISAPSETHRLVAGGNIALTPWRSAHQSLELLVNGGVDRAGLRDVFVAPPTLQSEQNGLLPGEAITNVGHLTYTSYSGSVVHHLGNSWLEATTSVGYASDREDNVNPVRVVFGLLSNPATGTGTAGYYYNYNATVFQHSYYAQEQIITLASRLALVAGVTAQSSTLNSNAGESFPYPHYAASYRFLHPWSVIDEIKLRAAYGVSGVLPPYGSKYIPYSPAQIGQIEGLAPTPSTGPVIKPEAVRETELGFDMPLLAGRAQLSATIYDKHGSDMLFEVPATTGYGGDYVYDAGLFKDQGAELELQATPLQLRNGFVWTTTATFSRSYSAVEAIPVGSFENSSGSWIAVSRSASEIANTNRMGADGLPLQIGDYLPGYEVSFSDALTFHHFRVFGSADWSRGGTAYDLIASELDLGTLGRDSVLAARNAAADLAGVNPWEESASYFTLRQVVVSYALPRGMLRHIGFGRIASAQLALTGYNLWSTFNFRGPDPQAAEFGIPQLATGTLTIGVPYPLARSYYLGLDLGL